MEIKKEESLEEKNGCGCISTIIGFVVGVALLHIVMEVLR